MSASERAKTRSKATRVTGNSDHAHHRNDPVRRSTQRSGVPRDSVLPEAIDTVVEKAVDGLSDQGPLSALGVIVGTMF
mgnify:CR=1 FL=1